MNVVHDGIRTSEVHRLILGWSSVDGRLAYVKPNEEADVRTR
jgi:hypothetical protein